MTGPVSARMVLADPQIDIAILETARGGLLRAGMGVPEVNVGAVLNVQSDHLGLKGIDTLEQLADVKRVVIEVAKDCAVLNADDPLVLEDVGLHRGQEHLLRHDEPAARAGARAHPCGRPRLRARSRRQRPDDHALRPQQPHPAGVDAPDPGDARRPRDAQRAERDVRGGDGLFARHQARRDPPRPAHVRLDVLPGAGPHERVQRTPVQGAVRLRSQRARSRGDGGPRAATGRDGTTHRRARRSGRPPRRRPACDRRCGRWPLRSLHLPARRQPARPRSGRSAQAAVRTTAIAWRAGLGDLDHSRRTGSDRCRARHGPARRPAADLRRRADPVVEADHQVSFRHVAGPGFSADDRGRSHAGRGRSLRYRRLHGGRQPGADA